MQDDELLYSNVCSLLVEKDDRTIESCFREEIKKSDQLEIAIGFASCTSLLKLDKLINQQNIKNVSLILGMYFFNGFTEELLRVVLEINKRWKQYGIGEIRLVYSFRYHVKLYCFLKDNKVYSAIIGSPNLSFLIDKQSTERKWQQYEMALLVHNSGILQKMRNRINSLK